MAYAVDMHVHSKYSGDNNSKPEDIIKMAINYGIHSICFTEHNLYSLSSFVEDLREKYKGQINLIRGVEFSCAEGHCLVFGCNTDAVMIGASAKTLINYVDSCGGIAIPSHPYRGDCVSMGDLIRFLPIQIIEGMNGKNLSSMNEMALNTARECNLGWTGGSDCHNPFDVGKCVTAFPVPVTQENIVALLRA